MSFPISYRSLAVLVLAIGLLCYAGPLNVAAKTKDDPKIKTKTQISGQGAVGARDGANKVSTDGGMTFFPAYIVAPHPAYSTIEGTRWISQAPNGTSPAPLGVQSTAIYETHFNLPATAANQSLTIQVHADNGATVYLNGNLVGGQSLAGCPDGCSVDNFQDPPTVLVDSNPAHFQKGKNVLRFVVDDFGVVEGLDYLATVEYTVSGGN